MRFHREDQREPHRDTQRQHEFTRERVKNEEGKAREDRFEDAAPPADRSPDGATCRDVLRGVKARATGSFAES